VFVGIRQIVAERAELVPLMRATIAVLVVSGRFAHP